MHAKLNVGNLDRQWIAHCFLPDSSRSWHSSFGVGFSVTVQIVYTRLRTFMATWHLCCHECRCLNCRQWLGLRRRLVWINWLGCRLRHQKPSTHHPLHQVVREQQLQEIPRIRCSTLPITLLLLCRQHHWFSRVTTITANATNKPISVIMILSGYLDTRLPQSPRILHTQEPEHTGQHTSDYCVTSICPRTR